MPSAVVLDPLSGLSASFMFVFPSNQIVLIVKDDFYFYFYSGGYFTCNFQIFKS